MALGLKLGWVARVLGFFLAIRGGYIVGGLAVTAIDGCGILFRLCSSGGTI